jgi:hypothetical protein
MYWVSALGRNSAELLGFGGSPVLGPCKDSEDCLEHMAQWMIVAVGYAPCKRVAPSIMAWLTLNVYSEAGSLFLS